MGEDSAGDERAEDRAPEGGAAEDEKAEDLKRDFESDPATNPEKAAEDPTLPEGLRGG